MDQAALRAFATGAYRVVGDTVYASDGRAMIVYTPPGGTGDGWSDDQHGGVDGAKMAATERNAAPQCRVASVNADNLPRTPPREHDDENEPCEVCSGEGVCPTCGEDCPKCDGVSVCSLSDISFPISVGSMIVDRHFLSRVLDVACLSGEVVVSTTHVAGDGDQNLLRIDGEGVSVLVMGMTYGEVQGQWPED
jgi:hypothetical protein